MPGGGPVVSSSPSHVPPFQYQASIDNTKTLISDKRGNLYGFVIENNSATAVFASFYDKASIGDVTLGTTAPRFTVQIPPSGKFGRDAQPHPYIDFGVGCVVAVVSSRNGAGAPAAAATGQFWFQREIL